jgi:hypothetical protein
VVHFRIEDARPVSRDPSAYPLYRVRIIVAGTGISHAATYQRPGAYAEVVRAPAVRMVGTVRVELLNERGETTTDQFTLGFNVYFYRTLKVRPLCLCVSVPVCARMSVCKCLCLCVCVCVCVCVC